ncbi:MAG: PhzF family phenazine biosynthesis protein [Candidatus Latescibacterota bacterium]|nr:MAG: PhzF family phenazine biosynthesis protein [Candidatus Latescibacterota bacterium]
MTQTIVQVDSFTDRRFAGNPAAVCIMESAANEGWMQDVAREMNLSETAFLFPKGDEYHLRWFTPLVEVDLCGHATLASAHVLFEDHGHPPDKPIRFVTRSGVITAKKKGDWIEFDFPASPVNETTPPGGLLEALGVVPKFVGKSQTDYLIEVESDSAVREVQPNFGSLASLPVQSVTVTGRNSKGEIDFTSRFFAPAIGIDEDPVTGFAHTLLAPYWSQVLGKKELEAYQASARGGVLRLRLEGDRVCIAGQAIIVLRGELV